LGESGVLKELTASKKVVNFFWKELSYAKKMSKGPLSLVLRLVITTSVQLEGISSPVKGLINVISLMLPPILIIESTAVALLAKYFRKLNHLI